jgi:putative ABC transport system permease protein
MIRAIHAQEGFGIFSAPIDRLAAVLGLAAVAGVIAAWRPARRGARIDVLRAIATA